jgi:hypothetical protein
MVYLKLRDETIKYLSIYEIILNTVFIYELRL